MSRKEVRITQTDDYPEYCRRDSGGSVADDYDSDVNDLTGAGNALWSADSDIMYLGWDAIPGTFGYRVGDTAPVVGAITWAYSNGAAGWTAFNGSNPFHDSTNGFTADGYVAVQNPPGASAWGKDTIDGTDAYWIKLTIASYTTTGKFLNWLRNMTLQNRLDVKPTLASNRQYKDTGGTLRKRDIVNTGVTALSVRCQTRATGDNQSTPQGQPNLSLLWYWWENQSTLYIEDLAVSTVPDLDIDAYFKDYTGWLASIPGDVESPSKMKLGNGYELAFDIQSSTAILS